MDTYEIKPEFVGKTLREISSKLGGRGDVLGNFFGVGENEPIQAGQTFYANKIPSNYRGSSSEWGLFQSAFAPYDANARQQEKALSARQQAIAPAVKSLEESIPEISQKFASERTRLEGGKDPLKERYKSILDELKRRETRDTEQETTRVARELGRRGITGGGLYDSEFVNATRPISEFYGTQTKDVSLSQEEGLGNIDAMIASLTGAETESVRAVRNTLAQLQAGAGEGAIQDAFNMLQMQEQQRQFDEAQVLEREKLRFAEQGRAVEEAMSQRNFAEQVRQYNVTLAENQRQFNTQESRLGRVTPKTLSPTKLEFREVTDSRGNEMVVALDPYSGKVVTTSEPIKTTNVNDLQNQFGGGFDLGQTIKSAWSWFNQ